MNSWKLHVGVDWASEKHDVSVVDPEGNLLKEKIFQNTGPGIQSFCCWLLDQHPKSQEIAIAIETPNGALVEALIDQGFAVFSLNPKQLDRFRDRFSPAGAKDDRLDAFVLATSHRTDERCFRRVSPRSSWLTELREWTRIDRELKTERTRLTNQMHALFHRYYLAFLQLGSPHENWLLELWQQCPRPALAKSLKLSKVKTILLRNRIRRHSAEDVLAILRQQPLPASAGTIKATTAHIELLVPRLQLLNQQIKQCDKQLRDLLKRSEEAFKEGEIGDQRDIELMLSVPGLGTSSIATLIAEGAALLRERDYQGLRCHTGAAPVTKRSGSKKRPLVVMRRACSVEMRTALYHWSRVSVQCHGLSKARYAALRARGVPHSQALRSIGDRNLKMLCAVLKAQTVFDPEHRTEALNRAA